MVLDEILKKIENRRLEFKQELPQKDQLAKTIIAFSNGAGGELYLGIQNEPREIVGLEENKLIKMEETIANIIVDNCIPTIIPEIGIFSVQEKYIIRIKVYPGYHTPYYMKKLGKDKGTIIRVGSTNRTANAEIIAELERKAKNISFDSVPLYDFSEKQIDLSSFQKFYQNKTGKVVDEEKLISMELVKQERDDSFPAHAAILLAEYSIRKPYFPFSQIECARFKGTTPRTFLDQQTINSPVFLQPEEAMKFVMRNISQSSIIGTVYREDRWEYPLDAIREAIVNAVIHRDYSILGSDIKLAIFDDMLEITSPGTFLPSIDVEHLENNPSEIRNKILAPIFKDCGMIEKWGSGWKKMVRELKDYPELELKIKEPGTSVQIQFIKKNDSEPTVHKNQSPQATPQVTPQATHQVTPQVMRMLKLVSGEMSRDELLGLLDLKDSKHFFKMYLSPAIKAELIARTKEKRNAPNQKYRLTEIGKKLLEKMKNEA